MMIIHLGDSGHNHIASSFHRAAAARMKRASAGSIEGTGDRPFDRDQALSRGLSQARHRSQKVHSVWMLGIAQDLAHRSILYHLPEIHDSDRICDLGDHAQVVRDKHDSHPQAFLQSAHQLEDLRLDRHVKGSGGSSAINKAGVHESAMAIIAR